MRVNVYAEEMTDKVQIISKTTKDGEFTGLRFWLHLPVTVKGKQVKGPFKHFPDDDDSAAVTFWGKRDMRKLLRKALKLLDKHYKDQAKWDKLAKGKKNINVMFPSFKKRLRRAIQQNTPSITLPVFRLASNRKSMVSRPGSSGGKAKSSLGTHGKPLRSKKRSGS